MKETKEESFEAPRALGECSTPSQGAKKRRVTRACNECRKRKVKCDGQLPCIHCSVYSYTCVYGSTARPGRKDKRPAPLVSRLEMLEAFVSRLLPGVDTTAEGVNLELLLLCVTPGVVDVDHIVTLYNAASLVPLAVPTPSSHPPKGPASPEAHPEPQMRVVLPSKTVALQLISYTWESACVLFRFYHRPSFIQSLNKLYEMDPLDYGEEQHRFLPLVYAVLACGTLFNPTAKTANVTETYDEGYRYFLAARKLVNITDASDIYSMQTTLMLIIFLQCLARLSTCYAYIGIALRLALREGLHRKLYHPNTNLVELEVRKRIFYTVYKLDIYINAMLGLPRSISENDFDQELPIELDDENITPSEYLPQMPAAKLSSAGIANFHTRLFLILGHLVQRLYSVRPPSKTPHAANSQENVVYLENELYQWVRCLPEELQPGTTPSLRYLKANRYLHLAYLHVQSMLYRPFIHYVAPEYSYSTISLVLQHQITNGRKCINAAIQIVKLAEGMAQEQLLSGAYWFSNYAIFFSVACLVFYVHTCSPERYRDNPLVFSILQPQWVEITQVAEVGKRVLGQLKDSGSAANRTYTILNQLFEQLNRRTAELNTKVLETTISGSGISLFAEECQSAAPPIARLAGLVAVIEPHTAPSLTAPTRAYQMPLPSLAGTGPTYAHPPTETQTDAYVSGIMDNVELQLFGRFLPPHMLPETGEGPGRQGSHMPCGLTSTSHSMTATRESTPTDAHLELGEFDASEFITDSGR